MTLRPAVLLLALSAHPALAELRLTSQVPGLEILPLATLPAAPPDRGETDFCSHLFRNPVTTPGGRDAAAKGWHVTAETALGDLAAVSFVGSATPATSGSCELLDGNIGLYSGDRLVALVYGTDSQALLIGSLRPFGEGVRILSGDLLAGTVADLSRAGDALTLTPPADEEPVCNGTGVVPAIEGLPIDKARQMLTAAGWEPVPGDPETQSIGLAQELAGAGMTEVGDCSGTGFAFCAFSYSSPAGELSVITAGEGGEDGSLPAVVRYDADCR